MPTFLLATLATISIAQAPSPNKDLDASGRPTWLKQAKPELTTNDRAPADLRRARADAYNLPQARALDSGPNNFNMPGFGNYSKMPSLPVSWSDAVIVATVINNQPFLSTDHARVYSELYVRPTEILKNRDNQIHPLTDITIVQEGGALTLPSGKVVSSIPMTGSKPLRINRTYLLFLKYNPSLEVYKVIHYWDLTSGIPVELDREGHPLTNQKVGEVSNIDTNAQLLETVKSKVR